MADNAEPSANGVSGDSTVTLPVHQEELRIGTRTVDTRRGVRVRKSVTERPYKIDEALLHRPGSGCDQRQAQRVHRLPRTRQVDDADESAG